ncbi:MAG: hypothetical protein ACJAS1_003981 [Oleiphilaceae bacterium]|jgi:hypothetical protein
MHVRLKVLKARETFIYKYSFVQSEDLLSAGLTLNYYGNQLSAHTDVIEKELDYCGIC